MSLFEQYVEAFRRKHGTECDYSGPRWFEEDCEFRTVLRDKELCHQRRQEGEWGTVASLTEERYLGLDCAWAGELPTGVHKFEAASDLHLLELTLSDL